MALDSAWILLKSSTTPTPDWSSDDRGYAEDPQFNNPIDRPEDFPDEPPEEEERAPIEQSVLDNNHIMRLGGEELRRIIAQVQGEIDRRADKRAAKGKSKVRVRL